MSDVSPGERTLLWLRWFAYDAGSRPVAVAGVLVGLCVLAAIVASVLGASSEPIGGFRAWVYVAVEGFRTDVQLGVLVAGVLLVIDALTGEAFRGQRALFALLMIVAAAGVVGNVTAIVAWLTEVGVPPIGVGTTAEGWTVIIASYLSPTVVAGAAGWLAMTGVRLLGNAGRDHI